jgi:site-specific DNA-methyltransferase (adenine-specific)
MPLRTSGITPVADLLTVFGRNNAICVENGICLPKKNGIFTSLAKMLGIQLGKYAKSVLSKELSSIKEFAVREIDSVKKLDGKISVFNLTIDGIPAFSTLAGESHNTQKPRILYDKILEWYGDKFCREKGIIDTFLGSGSSRLSAWDAGIDFVGIELNEVYFQKQELRFAEHVAKGSLYDRKEIETAECGEGLFEILLKRCDNPPAGFQRVF